MLGIKRGIRLLKACLLVNGGSMAFVSVAERRTWQRLLEEGLISDEQYTKKEQGTMESLPEYHRKYTPKQVRGIRLAKEVK